MRRRAPSLRRPFGARLLKGGRPIAGLLFDTEKSVKKRLPGRPGLAADFPLWKMLETIISYLSGIPGGIFAPSLAIGAGFGDWLAALVPGAPGGVVVLLGVVAYFSGVMQAPITAAVIVLEMNSAPGMAVPLMAASLLAVAASKLVCRRAPYGEMAKRFLAAGR